MTGTLLPFGHWGADEVGFAADVASAFLASFPLYVLCRHLSRAGVPLLRALCFCALPCYLLGLLCTVLGRAAQVRYAHEPFTMSWPIALAEAISSSLVLDAWCALYFGIKHYQTVQEQRARLLAAETAIRDAQLLALHYQLQPHFLFNTLNAISTLVVSHQPQRATEMIARLAGLLRTTLNSPRTHTVMLRAELAVIEEYLSIERVRFGERLKVSYRVAAEALEAHVPRFLLQPLVENAIRHGISRLAAGGSISISARVAAQELILEVVNDAEPSVSESAVGVGLSNTRARLAQLYGQRAALSVGPAGSEYRALLTIPYAATPVECAASSNA